MESHRIAQGKPQKIKFESHKEVAALLNHLHDYYNLSWPKISQLPAINPPDEEPIPTSTLAKIAQTEIVPKKWRHRFKGIRAIDNRQRIAISKIDMQSAFKTITNPRNIETEKAQELTAKLYEHFKKLPWK